jgi:pyruvate,water dikinase
MLHLISGTSPSAKIGSKAEGLMLLKNAGFNVPGGFILSAEIYRDLLEYNHIKGPVDECLSGMAASDLNAVSERLLALFSGFRMPDALIGEVRRHIADGKRYAVRSSGQKEDLAAFSFAGQYATFLNVSGVGDVTRAVIDCYRSMFSVGVLTYLANHRVSPEDLAMAVIVQEMVDSEKSGVAFTVNPLTGNDREMVIEIAEGLGDNLVSGRVKPESYICDWFDGTCRRSADTRLLDKEELARLTDTLLEIQMLFGFPCDIEFAFEAGKLYLLQARPITKIKYSGIRDQWTTADFKDGGVSTSVCLPFMWSLYEYIWEIAFGKFLTESKLLPAKELRKLGDMFFGRPYWNLSAAKSAMAKVPGYKEREFDSDLGVKITYEGDGRTTKLSLKSIAEIARVALAQKRILGEQNGKLDSFKQAFLEKYRHYLDASSADCDGERFEQIWYRLVKEDYLESEGTYFRQIFINTVHQALIKDKLLKYVSPGGYLDLIGGLKQISHLLPFYDLWELSRKIKADPESLAVWESDVPAIRALLEGGEDRYFMPELRRHIREYGYHSKKELDVSYPCYFEDTEAVIKMCRDTLRLDDGCNPALDGSRQAARYQAQLDGLKEKAGAKKYGKLLESIEKMRRLLWWREELRDISTRFYCIIRIYTLRLAEIYRQRGILESAGDIWYLKISDIFDFMEGKKSREDLGRLLARNKKYYASFRNYLSENEIGCDFDKEGRNTKLHGGITGIGCNNGVATGTARVIESLEEIDRLQEGDILVTKFTDTGWTSKFALLSGIVTEYGGILCHAAIISREYGIPCIVSVQDALEQIKDGTTITINGTTGEISPG